MTTKEIITPIIALIIGYASFIGLWFTLRHETNNKKIRRNMAKNLILLAIILTISIIVGNFI